MNYKSNLFLFISILICSFAFSQNKGCFVLTIEGNIDDDKPRNGKMEYILVKHDSVYARFYDNNFINSTEWEIDSIPEGHYLLKINVDSIELATFNNIIIETNKHNYYNIDYGVGKYKFRYPNDSTKVTNGKSDATINTLYGNNNNYEKSTIKKNQLLSIDLAINYYQPLAKYYSIGFKFGVQYAHTNFDNDTSSYLGKRALNKYYSTASINFGFINRFTFFNNKYLYTDGLKLDVGIVYNLPLFFKQVTEAENHTRITTKRIHTFTNFSAIVRLGYKYIGIQAEYSILDFLKTTYTEPPVLKVGIVCYIPLTN